MEETQRKERSREYPAIGLGKAIELAERIFKAERFRKFPASTAFAHMGYSGKTGVSAPALSAVKKFGLIEYKGLSPDDSAQLSELAKNIFLSTSRDERIEALKTALLSPAIYQELHERYSGWDLPSDTSLVVLLERDFGLQHKAIPGFLRDLRESIELVRVNEDTLDSTKKKEIELEVLERELEFSLEQQSKRIKELLDSNGAPTETRLLKLPMPKSECYIMLPEELEKDEAKRILTWIRTVVTPMINLSAEETPEEL